MASMAPVPISTAMVSPTMTPVERAVTRMLRIGLRLLGLREGHADPHAAALTRRHCGLAAELHGEPADQRQPEAAADIGPDRAARPGPVILDDQFDMPPLSPASMRISGMATPSKLRSSALLTASVTISPMGMAISGPTAMIGARI